MPPPPADVEETGNGSDMLFMDGYAARVRRVTIAGREWTLRQARCEEGLSGLVWPSAIVLAEYISDAEVDVVVGKRVIELGAGCGLASLAAAERGAAQVVATETADGVADTRRSVDDAANTPSEGRARLAVDVCDWCAPQLTLADYDVVLISDCIHMRALHDPLARLLATASPTTTILMTSQARKYCTERAFYEHTLPAYGLVAAPLDLADHYHTLLAHFSTQQLCCLYGVVIRRAAEGYAPASLGDGDGDGVYVPEQLLPPAPPEASLPRENGVGASVDDDDEDIDSMYL